MSILEQIGQIATLQDRIKQMSMIYDYSRKCHMAHVYGLDARALFTMPFVEYAPLLNRYCDEVYTRPGLPL